VSDYSPRGDIWIPSPLPFFLAGLFYYLVTPFLSLMFLSHQRLIAVAHQHISLEFFDHYYWLDVLVILSFFVLGIRLAGLLSKPSQLFNAASEFRLSPLLVLSGLSLLLLFLVFKIRSQGLAFFSGYESYDKSILGPLSTLVFTLALFYNFFSSPSIKRIFLVLFFISAILLLGFGARMFFLLGVIAVGIGFLSNRRWLLKSKWLYLTIGLIFILLLSVGIWRSGYSQDTDVLGLMLSIFAVEPLFTMTSASAYLSNFDPRPLSGFPADVIASFVNFIPSMFYPDKLELINEMLYDPLKASPFGASALLVNLYSNFGGFYPFYIFAVGVLYGTLHKKAMTSLFFRAIYFSLLPVLSFHFFREGFITVLKVIFFNGLFFPTVVVGVCVLFLSKQKLTLN
jgi:hypothetical protein